MNQLNKLYKTNISHNIPIYQGKDIIGWIPIPIIIHNHGKGNLGKFKATKPKSKHEPKQKRIKHFPPEG